MRLFYSLLICLMMNASLNGQKEIDQNQIHSLKDNFYKIAMSLASTVYKHPFMTCWSIYATFQRNEKIPKEAAKEAIAILAIATWFIQAVLLGDFAHNLLHAYRVNHLPCDNAQGQ